MNESKSDIKSITLTREDGSTEVIEKGFVATVTEGDESATVDFEMLHIGGRELATIIDSVLMLAMRLGYFNKEENAE